MCVANKINTDGWGTSDLDGMGHYGTQIRPIFLNNHASTNPPDVAVTNSGEIVQAVREVKNMFSR